MPEGGAGPLLRSPRESSAARTPGPLPAIPLRSPPSSSARWPSPIRSSTARGNSPWPLDNLNTGGGVRYDLPTRTQIALHVGTNRLDDPFQLQTSSRALPYNPIGTAGVTVLNRAKVIESARIEQIIPGLGDKGGMKAVLYGELHELASGQRETTPGRYQDVPSDGGFVLGRSWERSPASATDA